MSERLAEIRKQIKEIEDLRQPTYDKQRELEQEEIKICIELALAEAKKYVYTLEYNKESFNHITLHCQQDRDHPLDDALWKLGGSYHHTFYFGEKISLYQDDGQVYMNFEDADTFQSFIKEHGIIVDTSNFERQLKGFKKDIETLEKLAQSVKGTKP